MQDTMEIGAEVWHPFEGRVTVREIEHTGHVVVEVERDGSFLAVTPDKLFGDEMAAAGHWLRTMVATYGLGAEGAR